MKPLRTRRCNRERNLQKPLFDFKWEGAGSRMIRKPEDLAKNVSSTLRGLRGCGFWKTPFLRNGAFFMPGFERTILPSFRRTYFKVNSMRNFVSALSFLTLLPLGKFAGKPNGNAILYFPWVGILIGCSLAGIDWLGSLYLYDELRALTDVAFLALITGGLHLDGLADSADGLYFHHDKKKSLEVMKDPRVGVMGVLALIFCLGFKYTGILALKFEQCWIWLIVAPALARSAQVVGLVFMDDARGTGGVGQALYQKGRYQYLMFCLIPLALPFWVSTFAGITVVVAFVAINLSIFVFFRYRLGGMTGDTFGALTEIIESFFLIFGGLICKGLI